MSDFRDELRNTVTAGALATNNPGAGGTLTVGSTAGFPATGTIKVGNEKLSYTGLTATTFTGIQRGVDGTSAAASAAAAINDPSVTATATTITYDTITNGPLPPKGIF